MICRHCGQAIAKRDRQGTIYWYHIATNRTPCIMRPSKHQRFAEPTR